MAAHALGLEDCESGFGSRGLRGSAARAAARRSKHTGMARVASATRRKCVFIVIPLRSHSISNVACSSQGGSNNMKVHMRYLVLVIALSLAAAAGTLREPGQARPAARHRHFGAGRACRTAHVAGRSGAGVSGISAAELRKSSRHLPGGRHAEAHQRFRHQDRSLDAGVRRLEMERKAGIGRQRRVGRKHQLSRSCHRGQPPAGPRPAPTPATPRPRRRLWSDIPRS